jgi:putative flippase GtrA
MQKNSLKKALESTLSKYVLVGITSLIIYYFFLFATFTLLHFHYSYCLAVALFFSVLCHFLLNQIITFKFFGRIINVIPKYLLIVLINYLIQIMSISFLLKFLNLNFYTASFFAVCLSVFFGFFALKYFVFKI